MDNLSAPIPAFGDLRFLFYRWGYHLIGDKGSELFCVAINSLFYDDGVDIYARPLGYHLLNNSSQYNQLSWLELAEGEWFTDIEAEKLGLNIKSSFECDDLLKIQRLNLLPANDEIGIAVGLVLRLNEVIFLPIEHEFMGVEEIDGSPKIINKYRFNGTYSMEQLVITRRDLMAFEQRSGFVNHGLILEEAPKPKKRINPGFEKYNEIRKIPPEELEGTVQVFLELKKQNPKVLKTALLEIVGDQLGISGQGVKKRLINGGYSTLLDNF